jgi:hypothetical protein
MAEFIESSGEIEILCVSRQFRTLSAGDKVELVFKPIDAPNPPYQLKVTSPSGKTIVDVTIRALPTGDPQSPPPFECLPSVNGDYRIEIRERNGRSYGACKLKVG